MAASRGGAGLATAIALIAVLLGGGNVFLFARAVQQLTGAAVQPVGLHPVLEAVAAAYARAPETLVFLGAAPVVAGLLLALVVGMRGRGAPVPAEAVPAETAPVADPTAPALRVLALLQQEGRLIDFLEEDIGAYSDAQVGAAVRSIHGGCRAALHERMRIERVFAEDDGAEIEIGPGFDPATVRLTGNVHGAPPFRGTLQHGGWRATNVALPEAPGGLDPAILAPAEVEIP